MLAEIMAQTAGLIHIGPQLHIAAGFHGQKLIFAVQPGVAGVFHCHPVHLVQQQEDAKQGDGHGQHRDDHDPVDEDDGRVPRHTEDEEGRVDGGQRPRRLPKRFAVVLPQQPCAPPDSGEGEDGTQHHRKRQRDHRCGRKRDRLVVAGLGAGIQHRSQQRADRQHHRRNGEQEGRLGDRHPRSRPPPQQPERHDEDRQQEIVARHLQHRADPRADSADHRDQPCRNAKGPARRGQVLPQRGKAEIRSRIQ